MSSLSRSNNPISQWAEDDRPREKLLSKGRASLSDSELLAILIGSGTPEKSAVDLCKEILDSCHQNLNDLGKLTVSDLMKFKGIGEAKAVSIVAALELGRRRRIVNSNQKESISSSQQAFEILSPHMSDLLVEEFWIILLNRANKIIKTQKTSSGGISGTVADVRLIFKAAVENMASAIILAHNHPSGNIKPSQTDIKLTAKFVEAGKNLDISVLDHIIIADKQYFSFADEGLI